LCLLYQLARLLVGLLQDFTLQFLTEGASFVEHALDVGFGTRKLLAVLFENARGFVLRPFGAFDRRAAFLLTLAEGLENRPPRKLLQDKRENEKRRDRPEDQAGIWGQHNRFPFCDYLRARRMQMTSAKKVAPSMSAAAISMDVRTWPTTSGWRPLASM